jgi:hypothetical protein
MIRCLGSPTGGTPKQVCVVKYDVEKHVMPRFLMCKGMDWGSGG